MSLTVGLVLLAGCTGNRPVQTSFSTVPTLRLAAFDNCDDLLTGLRAAAKESVGPYGFGTQVYDLAGPMETGPMAPGPVAADGARSLADTPQAATPAYSGTNTHEAGVDEPDLVKTDGRRIVTVHGGALRVIDAATRTVTGSLPLDPGRADANLLLAGNHALVLTTAAPVDDALRVPVTRATLILVDISAAPRVLGRYTVDGAVVDARQVGSVARVVVHSTPNLPFDTARERPADQRIGANRAVIDEAPIEAWLPSYTVDSGGRRTTGRVDCGAVSRPAAYSGTSMLTVLSFDLGGTTLGTGNPTGLVADGDTVYSNGSSLYIATDNRWRAWPMLRLSRPVTLDGRTELYKFDIAGRGKPKYVAGGSVPGWMINQYAMSEWDGKLRVATTLDQPWASAGKADSSVYVLDGALREIGHVGGLGRGERIYAVRFVGPTGYVVTFRQTDPLYVVDLRNPATPAVTGELKINGYSAYLHPAGDGRLIGVGQAADPNGRIQGVQVSLFDVSDPTRPARLSQYVLPGSYTEAQSDPHAFLYWPPTGLVVVPVWQESSAQAEGQVLALRLAGSSISRAGAIAGPGGQQIRRSLMIGDVLWTVSDTTVAAYQAGTFAKLAEL